MNSGQSGPEGSNTEEFAGSSTSDEDNVNPALMESQEWDMLKSQDFGRAAIQQGRLLPPETEPRFRL